MKIPATLAGLCTSMLLALTTVTTVTTATTASAAAAGYAVQTVDYPGAANTALYAINVHGHYVGAEKDGAGRHHAIWFDGHGLALLDAGGPVGQAVESWAYAINGQDDVAGVFVDAAGTSHGYVRHAGGAVEVIDAPGALSSQAYGINDHGSLIGLYTAADGATHAFARRGGRFATIDLAGALETVPLSINDLEEVAGEYLSSADTLGHGYIQQPDGRYRLYDAPGAAPAQTYFISINNRHQVLGAFIDGDGAWHNVIRSRGSYLPFELPAELGAGFVSAQTINDRGDIVGYYIDGSGRPRGFVATAQRAD